MSNTKQAAKTIRTELKAQGISSRQVSVRIDTYSMGSSIDIVIKDPAVKLADVTAIAQSHERIDRCSITGDILSGGNRYLHIGYSSEASKTRAAPYVAKCEAAMQAIDGTSIETIEGDIGISRDAPGSGFQLWNGSRAGMHVNTAECAARIVSDYIDENAAKVATEAAAMVDELVAYPALRLLP